MLQHNASLREFLYQFSHSTLDDVGIVTKLVQDPLYIRRRQKERIQLAKAAQDPSLKKRRPNDDVLLSRISEIHLDNRLRLAAMREGSAIKLDIFPDYHLTENYLFELKQGQLRVNVQERGIDWTEYDALAKFDDLYGLFEVKLNSTMQKGRTKRVKKRGKYRTVDRMRESKFGTIRTKASGGGLNYCMSDVR
ncbi:MAG: hypothetical protein QGH47_07745, partial [Candidatus Woesearchaeota archaeon]|nr:hypothetical protein [Candidatus Woesearchaeota archaeon]